MERKETHYLKSILLAGLGFGVGGVVGNFLLLLLVRSQLLRQPLSLIPEGQPLVLLLAAITLTLLGVGIATGLGGAIGGFVLSVIDPIYPRNKYLWRTAIATGLSEMLLIIPIILLIAILGIYNNGLDRDPSGLVVIFGILGLIFGLVLGLILGFSTVYWRQVWRIILATVVGFTLGGAVVGYGIRFAYYPASLGEGLPDFRIYLPVFAFLFFGIGGMFLGWVYEWVTHWRVDNVPDEPARWVKVAGVLALLALAFFIVSNYRQLVKFLTFQPGSVSSQIEIDTSGVHWKGEHELSRQLDFSNDSGYSISASADGQVAAVWSERNEGIPAIYLTTQDNSMDGEISWEQAIKVSVNAESNAIHPEVIVDKQGNNHVVWTEESVESSDVYYSICSGESCIEPIALSTQIGSTCTDIDIGNISAYHDWPVIATAGDESIMALWTNADNILFYTTWSLGENPASSPTGCLTDLSNAESVQNQLQPRLGGAPDGRYLLTYFISEAGDEIVYQMEFIGQAWNSPQSIGSGISPNVFIPPDGTAYLSWCNSESKISTKDIETGLVEVIDFPNCRSRPSMSLAESGDLHLVWYSDEIRNNLNVVSETSVIYESIKSGRSWSDPAIVDETVGYTLPIISGMGKGNLNLIWSVDSSQRLNSAYQPYYACSDEDLGDITREMLAVIENGSYHPEDEQIPYCKNQYRGMIYMPNPENDYSPQPPSENGGFDNVSNLASLVEYEVDLAVMEWAEDEDGLGVNPGSVYTREIANLYQHIKDDPSRYPRGLTVRILLGNYPELSKLEWGEQIWNVIEDLRNAGVDKMVDQNIGWKIEVANYKGVYPHSHTKFMVVDGKLAVGAGFNYGYLHLPFNHPSNKGGDLYDLGIIISGPIAQQALATFDDYWQGSNQLHCPDLSPDPGFLWTRDCTRSEGQAVHVPEVKKYFLPAVDGELSNAFSLSRNYEFKESDDVILAAISSAQETLDILEVNFSLELICALDLLNDDVCSYDDALDYMKAILTSVEQNQTKVRVLVEKVNSNGMENRIAAKEFTRELERLGLDQFVEIRFFDGRMHAKAFLVDNEVLFVGSQNFHYSAWGEAGLAEYNLATDDPRAVSTFRSLFDYYWEKGIPWEEYDPN